MKKETMMIRLTDTPYDIEGSYNKQKDLLEPSLLILKSMKKTFNRRSY